MLTPRQMEVARFLARGMTDKEIARELGLSRRTVEDYIAQAAARIPGEGKPRVKVAVFFVSLREPAS